MKRWIHATEVSDTHAQHVADFNNYYSKNIKDRVQDENGKVYFLSYYQVSQLVKAYNKKHEDANLDVKTELSDYVDEEGREYGHYVVY